MSATDGMEAVIEAMGNEPIFVLLARDHRAPRLVRQWAETHRSERISAYEAAGGSIVEDYPYGLTDKEREALDCADAMDAWRASFPNTETTT